MFFWFLLFFRKYMRRIESNDTTYHSLIFRIIHLSASKIQNNICDNIACDCTKPLQNTLVESHVVYSRSHTHSQLVSYISSSYTYAACAHVLWAISTRRMSLLVPFALFSVVSAIVCIRATSHERSTVSFETEAYSMEFPLSLLRWSENNNNWNLHNVCSFMSMERLVTEIS